MGKQLNGSAFDFHPNALGYSLHVHCFGSFSVESHYHSESEFKIVEEPPCKFETQWAKLRVGQSKIIRLTISDKRRPSILTTD